MNNINSKTPKFLALLCFTEMWERFSYYGMRALLILFLTTQLGFADPSAYSIYCLFAALSYAGPVIGGLLADRLLGFRKMVVLGGIIMVIGHALMVLIPMHSSYLYLGLGFIAVGTGMFKGNITNLLGSCYQPTDPKRGSGFTLFHVSINIGSLLASLACGYVAQNFGWHYGFGLAGIGMLLGLICFVKFQHILGENGLAPKGKDKPISLALNIKTKPENLVFTLCIIGSGILGVMLYYSQAFSQALAVAGSAVVAYILYLASKLKSSERKSVIFLLVLAFFFTMFLVLEMQIGALFNLFAERNIDRVIFGREIHASVLQGINPFSIIFFGPVIAWIYKSGNPSSSMARYTLGLASIIGCFAVLYVGCLNPNPEGYVSVWYLFFGICIMGVGELFIVPVVLNFFTVFSPAHLKGFMMGVLMLAAAFSNLAGNVVAKYVSVPKPGGLEIADTFASLAIYKAGFLQILYFNILVLAVFLFLYPWLNAFVKNSVNVKPEPKLNSININDAKLV